jgi:hypothetical protein
MSDAAIASIVTGAVTVVTLVIGFLTLWVKLKYGDEQTQKTVKHASQIVQDKIDDNTTITKVNAGAAVVSAVAAAKTAADTKSAVEGINRKLNGGIDAAVQDAVKPLHDKTEEQGGKLEKLTEYVHQRNHDILTALQIQANKIETVIQMVNRLTTREDS